MKSLSLTITAIPSEISPAIDIINQFFEHQGVDEKSRFELQVVLAESLGNAIKHSLKGGSYSESVYIHCESEKKRLIVTTRDNGQPLAERPDYVFPDAASQNGRGWPIIFSWMDNVEYYAKRGTNYLELTKFLVPPKTT